MESAIDLDGAALLMGHSAARPQRVQESVAHLVHKKDSPFGRLLLRLEERGERVDVEPLRPTDAEEDF